jgi:AraC family transcriptional regulator
VTGKIKSPFARNVSGVESQVHVLHQSDFYQIRDFRCACTRCSVSKLEEGLHFFIIFVRQGFYEQRVFRANHEMHVGSLLVSKPEIAFTIRHIDNHPDLCTSFRFEPSFYEQVKEHYGKEGRWFFANPDLHSVLLSSSPSIEFLHHHILSRVGHCSKLEMDALVIRLLEKVMHTLDSRVVTASLSESVKKHHLTTMEKAKEYLFHHFTEDVSLAELADHCHVSMFHFSRLFKAVLNTTAHRYLTELRLNHAQLLLQSTQLPITQIAFRSGFHSLEHFDSTYKNWFKTIPTDQRNLNPSATYPLDSV